MPTLRDRILDAGVELICTAGWDRTTMAQVADRVGVSRQMVYKEIGARDKLARAIVVRHAEVFLSGVVERLREHGPDPLAGIPAAVEYVLRAAADDPLLKAVLAAGHGGTQDLLPLLTIQPEPVLGRALATLQAESAALYRGLGLADLPTLVEVVVRLTLSHLVQPSGPVERAVGQAEWLVRAALSGPRDVT
ncbi:AcrR family transcriptional regulator [Amycolatopsis bartoniae]|uniref:TetR family transcriptional regulator n=1 Tax=Amycolatopsis bartoniae TaxID=941986 RepID=A0A8H9M6X4_9PSEU|nr:TetR/AcrR family transcriptional regulator [Amycolatopsis bartoniae]MBB2936425.1 AcrR family transcriptional regulator [Amycolatopsis bartoniae]TVT11087.1 TetR/AcrR family transcriptional regulator [Amycolatopsis bartoniae]GHF69030.1 TetR family transcriptional regulator [Amycolatopsis bartoniae]